MNNIGYVKEVSEKTITVAVPRQSACGGNCSGCKGCPSDTAIVTCDRDDEFSVGQQVMVEMGKGSFFGGIFLTYGVMTITLFSGAVIGYLLFRNELASVLGGILGVISGGGIVKATCKGKEIKIKIKKAE